jgi:hypothetical protein
MGTFLFEVFGAFPWISLCVFLEMQVDVERDLGPVK